MGIRRNSGLLIRFLFWGMMVTIFSTYVYANIEIEGQVLTFQYAENPAKKIPFLGENSVVNLNASKNKSKLLLGPVRFGQVAFSPQSALFTQDLVIGDTQEIESTASVKLLAGPLNFPNPFRMANGTTLVYTLNKPATIQIYVYDMLANELLKETFPKNSPGGSANVNKVRINFDTFNRFLLSSGVYFYYIFSEGKLLGKGKMAIIP